MVYQGKPSRGCSNCKKSHIKCDEAKPSCSLCVKRKIACPGYRDSFDLILRDQTISVQRNTRRKYTKASTNSPKSDKIPKDVEVPLIKPAAVEVDEQDDEKNSLARILPPSLHEDVARAAIGFFFSSYILFERDPEASRGFLELLPSAFLNGDSRSVLNLSTTALAMTILGGRSATKSLAWQGRQMFVEALATLKEVLKDPVRSKSDETLMGVIVTGMTEDLLSIKDGVVPTKAHTKGSLALLKHRGKDNFANPTARSLLMAIWTQIVSHATINTYQFGSSPTYFPSEQDEQFMMDKNCVLRFGPIEPVEPIPDEWMDDLRNIPVNTAGRLTKIGEECARLKRTAMGLLNSPRATQKELTELFILASMVDGSLLDWVASVPCEWWPKPAADNSPEQLYRFGAWGQHMDVYIDLWVASVWNAYRQLRLDVQGIFLAISNRKWPGEGFSALKDSRNYLQTMQGLVDDICMSVPYMIGDKCFCGVGSQVPNFPWFPDSTMPSRHKTVGMSLGGWYLFAPLCGCLSLEPYAGQYMTIVEVEQRQWIMNKLELIMGSYGMSNAKPWLLSAVGLKYVAL